MLDCFGIESSTPRPVAVRGITPVSISDAIVIFGERPSDKRWVGVGDLATAFFKWCGVDVVPTGDESKNKTMSMDVSNDYD